MKPEYLDLQSADGSQINIDALYNTLYQIAPSCFTEANGADGKVRKAINFDVLRQLLGDAVADTGEEFYQFTWPGKAEARREAARPIKKTLRPVKDDSVDWDTTQNLYIEGDNLEVLKLLQKSYLGKVKMIYIDPPYNTGKDFVYDDDFSKSANDYAEASADIDALGNRYRKNTDSNGRFHSDWCSMMLPRIQIARSLLSEDGVILLSIDDNEIENLRKICDEIFGEDNFVAQMIWQGGKVNTAKFISTSHDYILIFAKNLSYCSQINEQWKEKKKGLDEIYAAVERIKKQAKSNSEATKLLKDWFRTAASEESKAHAHYCNIDNNGAYCMDNVSRVGGGKYSIVNPINGLTINPPSRGWVFGKEEDLWKAYEKGILEFGDNNNLPILKRYLNDNEYQLLDTVFYKDRRGAKLRLRELLDGDIFDYPKDETVLQTLIFAFTNKDSLILDFFSGSATTAHAVMQLNAEDGGKRRFIMVQLPEETEADSEARKAGYANICEIGKERIRRAGKKVKEEVGLNGQDLDIGFRVFRVDTSNMEDVYFAPKSYSQDKLDMFLDNVKADRTDLDLLFGAMLDWGVQLSLPMRSYEVVKSCSCEEGSESSKLQNSTTVYVVNEGDLVACFAEDITEEVIEFITDQSPLRVLLRDSCFSSDADKINIFEQFKQRLGWSDEEAYKNIRVI